MNYGAMTEHDASCRENATRECFMPNAATGFLLQSILRGHVDERTILEDETTFWSGRPDGVNKVLISTTICGDAYHHRSPSAVMSSALFALPKTPAPLIREQKEIKRANTHRREVDAHHGGKSFVEKDIHDYGSLVDTLCDSFDIPKYVISARSFR